MPIEFKTPPYEHMPQTPEEAEAYRENYLTGMRSGIRGPVQGIASLSAMGDIPALLELGAYEQAGLPAYERGLIDYEDIPRAGYGETRQKHLETIGEAVVPGETIESGVHGSQLLTELAGIGVVGKQAIDLIRKYGPLAVTRIKSIFARKPGATVDAAVNEALKVTRRDVLQTGGAGIAALAVPGAAWKLGSAGAKTVTAAATAARNISGAKIFSMINKIPAAILKKTASFGAPPKGTKIPSAKKMWNEDWSPKYGGKSTGAIIYRRNVSNFQEMKGVQEIEHLDRTLMASKPHFEKYGLKPNEITRMNYDESGVYADADAWFSGHKQKFVTHDEAPFGKWRVAGRRVRPEDDLGELWHSKLDFIYKWREPNPKGDMIKLEEALDLSEVESVRPLFAQSVKDARYLGENKVSADRGRIEFFEIDGIPVARQWPEGDIYLPNMKGMERLSGSKKMLQKELAAEEKLERIIAKAVEETKTTPRPEKVQKIIDAKRKAEGKAHGGIVDKAIVGGERYI